MGIKTAKRWVQKQATHIYYDAIFAKNVHPYRLEKSHILT